MWIKTPNGNMVNTDNILKISRVFGYGKSGVTSNSKPAKKTYQLLAWPVNDRLDIFILYESLDETRVDDIEADIFEALNCIEPGVEE